MVTKGLTALFLLLSVFVGYQLVNSIKTSIDLTEKLEMIKEQKIEKLEMIREAAIAYEASKGQYTASWDTLMNFVNNDSLFIVNKTEKIFQKSYGVDSAYVLVDTLGSVSVMDSLFSAVKWPNFKASTLAEIPFSEGKKFELYAGKMIRGGVSVNVFEALDINPQDPKRIANGGAKALRVGSRTEVTTSGNWE